ncbi:MAG: hypothetical protein JOZ69_06365 [Myxococcales bacterium]|nr:hypothetical protein [Myxococcales bacterium]
MSAHHKRGLNPNATIQLSIEDVQLAELSARLEGEAAPAEQRPEPPPLPTPSRPAPPAAMLPAEHSAAKKIAYGAMVLTLLTAAIAAGWRVGDASHRTQAAPSAATGPTGLEPPESSSAGILTLPTIVVR